MQAVQQVSSYYPKAETGYFHLTERGWIRKDSQPFPQDRIETWLYEMECGSEADKEQVRLTRIWVANLPEAKLDVIREHHGEPVAPSHNRHIILECR